MQFKLSLVNLIKQKKIFSVVNCIGLVRSIDRLEFFSIAKENKILLVEFSLLKRFVLISETLFVGNYLCFLEVQSCFGWSLSVKKYKQFKEQEKFNLFFDKMTEILPFSNDLFKTFGLGSLRKSKSDLEIISDYNNEIKRGSINIYPRAFVFLEIGRVFSAETLTRVLKIFSFVSFWVVFFFRLQSRSVLFNFRIISIDL